MKRFILPFLCLVLLIGGIYAYRWSITPAIGVTSTEISSRAKEFVENQPTESRIIQPDAIEPLKEAPSNQSATSDCFAVTFPIPVRNIKHSNDANDCTIKATSDRPKAHYTLSSSNDRSFLEHTGYTLRNNDTSYIRTTSESLVSYEHALFTSHSEVTLFLIIKDRVYIVSAYDMPVTNEASVQIVTDLAKSIRTL